MLNGIDYSYGSGVTAAQVKAGGYAFVMRYLSGGNSKDVSAAEITNYAAAGIAVGFVFETTGAPGSAAQGAADAKTAQAELVKLQAGTKVTGLENAVVYFAIDEESNPNSVAYIKSAASVLGAARTGVYGGYGTVSEVLDAGVCKYAWQTYAWSSGVWDNRAILRQVQNDIKVGPCDADHDELAYFNVATPVFGTADLASVGFVGVAAPAAVAPAKPAAPVVVLGTPAPKAVAQYKLGLSWAAVANAHEYWVEVADSTGKTIYASNTLTATSVVVPVAARGTYTYRVACMTNGSYHASAWSKTLSATV